MTTMTAASMTPMKQHVWIGELMLADDRRSPDAEAGDDQHEDGPDQDKKHGKLPLSELVGNAVERGDNAERERMRSPAADRSRQFERVTRGRDPIPLRSRS